MFGVGTQLPESGGHINVVLGSMQPKLCVICTGLDVAAAYCLAAGWGFATGWGFAAAGTLQWVLKMHRAKPGTPASIQ